MITPAAEPPQRNRVRGRLAIGLTLSTLLAAMVVAVAATAVAGWRADETTDGPQAGAARVGDDVTVVIVTDEGADDAAAQARRDTLRWSLIFLAISIVPAIGLGWFVAGRMLGTVDKALADIESADAERLRRLQEVVHELRTPLAVMGTNLELAATEPGPDHPAAGFIDAARRAVIRMGRTVEDLAGHGRLEVAVGKNPVDIGTLAREVAADHAGPAQARSIRIRVKGDPMVAVPDVDPAALRTTLGNFLANAVRLAPGGSAVTLTWGQDTTWAWLAVGDEGPGLSPELHGRVFERGWRGRHDRDRDGANRGSGLGLTIARQLTEAQGGSVTVLSEEGGGSVFTIWLPVTAAADPSSILAADGIHPAVQPWLEVLAVS